MTEITFKTGISYLKKWFGTFDNELYPMYWNVLKSITDDVFMEVVEKIVMTFVPTAQCPFPLPFHFSKAHDEIKSKTITINHQAYLPFTKTEVDKSQLPTEADFIKLREMLPKGIRDKMYLHDRFRDGKGMKKISDILD